MNCVIDAAMLLSILFAITAAKPTWAAVILIIRILYIYRGGFPYYSYRYMAPAYLDAGGCFFIKSNQMRVSYQNHKRSFSCPYVLECGFD